MLKTAEYTASAAPAPDDRVKIWAVDRNDTPYTLRGVVMRADEDCITLATKSGPVIVKADSIDDIRKVR